MNVAEASGNGEVGADGLEGLDDGQDVLGLGVERVVVDILVVHTVLLTTSDADLHLQPLLHGSSALQVGCGGLDVVVDGLLRQVDHVRGEEGLAVLLEVLLVGVEQTVEPWQKLLGAVVGVQDDGDAVCGSNGSDVVCCCDATGNGGSLVLVVNALTGEVGGTTLGCLPLQELLAAAGGGICLGS